MGTNRINIAFILDEGFIVPTATAITSLIKNKENNTVYNIYLITSNLSEESIIKFNKYKCDTVLINIIKADGSKYENFHEFDSKKPCCATVSALLKFELPHLLADIDKVLYMDGDILVQKDLSELYKTELENNYAAAVKDSGRIYYRTESTKHLENYFNSGVMLLNLKMMRENNMTERLIEAKKNSSDMSLMDQNIFNIVFEGAVKFLDIKYNFLYLNLTRAGKRGLYTINDINNMFSSSYSNLDEIKEKACIIHFSSKDKPWKYSNIIGAKEWLYYYKKSYFYDKNYPIQNQKVTDYLVDKNEDRQETDQGHYSNFFEYIFSIKNIENKKLITILGIKIKLKNKLKMYENRRISVIIPVYNTEKYLRKCLNSIVNQTFKDIEIICVDDCSNDSSLSILKEYQARDSRIKVFSLSKNLKQGGARNKGLSIATGKYITFVDSDDYIEPTFCETLLYYMENYNTDIVIDNLENHTLSQDKKLLKLKNKFDNYYNESTKLNGLYKYSIKDKLNIRIGPVGKLYKSEIIRNNHIKFPECVIEEDNAFFWYYMCFVNNIFVINKYLYKRLIHSESTMYLKFNYNKNSLDFLKILDSIYKFLKKHKLYKKYKSIYIDYFNKATLSMLENAQLTNNEKQQLIKKINKMKYQNSMSTDLEKIFSIKNIDVSKVITILGIKLKFKSKRLVERKRITNIENNLSKSKKNVKKLKNIILELKKEVEKPEISIILPVYNSELYLKNCLDSITKQTYENIEIICIDDGSTDNSLSILKEYADHDNRFIIRTQENMGVGATRNRGLKIAKGNYLSFIDDDDDFVPDMLEIMHQAFNENNTDIVCCAWNILDENKISKKDIAFSGNTKLNNEIRLGINVELWNKLFKKSIIDEFDIKFPNYSLGDDTSFTRQYLMLSQYVTGIKQPLYNHYRRQNSITGKLRHDKTKFIDSIMSQAYTLTFIQSLSEYSQPRNYEFYLLKLKDYLHIYLENFPPEQHIEILNKIKIEILDRIPDKYITDEEFKDIKNNNYNNYILTEVK